ncbi:hypothetical protein AGMMS4952_13840 [Spirochaetia bacterium]|nr:hypothetical protein AGMMS4952_13840 [Spirochaetia bacterium]
MKKQRLNFLAAVLLAGIVLAGCPTEEAYMPEITPEVIGIVITKRPDNTTYEQYGGFDTTGLVVTATFDDGSEENVTDRIEFVSAWRLDIPGDQLITVSFGSFRASYPIKVLPST